MKKIFCDTNFLIDVVRFKADLAELDLLVGPHIFVVPTSVMGELEKISKSNKSTKRHATSALRLAAKFEIEKSNKQSADEDLISKADDNSFIATNDMELRKRLRGRGIKSIYLRARKHLAIG